MRERVALAIEFVAALVVVAVLRVLLGKAALRMVFDEAEWDG